ncbi:MAG TPA: hypothetical protein VF596_11825 [Pyrinomonadaceae bacterium]|jgi:hypothetical protein
MMKRKKIKILPREPLTQKAQRAIERYAKIVGKNTLQGVVAATLKAERMRRSDLYSELERRGFVWIPKFDWETKKDAESIKLFVRLQGK